MVSVIKQNKEYELNNNKSRELGLKREMHKLPHLGMNLGSNDKDENHNV